MHKKLHEKIRDAFIQLGKKYRILLPVAVIGLALTMFFSNIYIFCIKSAKRFAFVAFILCFFLIGNSFAFAKLYNNGFVSLENNTDVVAANDSELKLTNSNEVNERLDDASMLVLDEEELQETVIEDDLIYLDDILVSYDNTIDLDTVDEKEASFSADDWRLVLINKQHPIPDDYEFTLGNLSGNMRCDERIINDLLLMMNDAKNQGITLIIGSPYRDLSRQEMLFERRISNYMKKGYSYMDAYKLSSQAITVPGSSEHQVGLAIDFLSDDYKLLDEGFKNTKAGIWLKENAADYGFILRYTDNKEDITSIEFEPWHYRYVGREAAKIIMEEEICLEEFWEKYL